MAIIGRTGATPPDLTRVRPYGDTLDDGAVQLSFTLPVPFGDEAREAARLMAIVAEGTRERVYLAPTAAHEAAALTAFTSAFEQFSSADSACCNERDGPPRLV
jgi:hypothetical protein